MTKRTKKMKTVNTSTLRRYLRSILAKAQKEDILVVSEQGKTPQPLVVITKAPDA